MAWQVDECKDECNNNSDECCNHRCIIKKIGFATYPEDPTQPDMIEPEGLVYSFMLSVDNDTTWEPVIRNSVKRCYDDNNGVSTDLVCNFPMELWVNIVTCSFWENFLRCPNFNPNGTAECETTIQFLTECKLNG